jgi:hypothetical protein
MDGGGYWTDPIDIIVVPEVAVNMIGGPPTVDETWKDVGVGVPTIKYVVGAIASPPNVVENATGIPGVNPCVALVSMFAEFKMGVMGCDGTKVDVNA